MAIGDKISGKSGRVKFGAAVNISSATCAGGVATINFAAAHNLLTGDRIAIAGVTGMTDLNRSFTCTKVDADTVTVPLSTVQAYVSGGSMKKCIEITKWDLTKTADLQDVSDSSNAPDGWKANQPSGWKSFSGGFEGFLYAGTNPPDEGSVVAADLEADGVIKYSGNIILNSEATSLGVVGNEAVKVAYQFTGDGALAKTDGTV
jgi:hypothetical protein